MNLVEHNLTRLVLKQADELTKEIGAIKQAIGDLPHRFKTDIATGQSTIAIEVPKRLRETFESLLKNMLEQMLEDCREKYESLTPIQDPQTTETQDHDHDEN